MLWGLFCPERSLGGEVFMTTAAVLLIGALIVAIMFTGPTIWYDWKENREKRVKLAKAG